MSVSFRFGQLLSQDVDASYVVLPSLSLFSGPSNGQLAPEMPDACSGRIRLVHGEIETGYLMLTALVLYGDRNTRWAMSQSDSRFRFIDVLNSL
jgi:hypothetical protein